MSKAVLRCATSPPMGQKGVPPNNAAARLSLVMERAVGAETAEPTARVWATALLIPADDTALTARMVTALLTVPDDIEREVRAIPKIPHDRLLEWKGPVLKVLSNSLEHLKNPWANVKGPLDAKTLFSLATCADQLTLTSGEHGALDATELSAIRKELGSLIERVITGSLPEKLRAFVLEQLREAEYALQLYAIHGPKALADALTKIGGSAILKRELAKESRQTAEGKDAWQLLNRLCDAVVVSDTVLGKWIPAIFLALVSATPLDPSILPPDEFLRIEYFATEKPVPAVSPTPGLPAPTPGPRPEADTDSSEES